MIHEDIVHPGTGMPTRNATSDDEAVVTANCTGNGNGTGKCMGKGKGTGNRRGNAKRTGKGTNKRKTADNHTATGKYPKSSASTHIPKREVSWATELVDYKSVVTEGPGVDENSVVTEVPESDAEFADPRTKMKKYEYFKRGLQFGVDGSRLEDKDFVYIIPTAYPPEIRRLGVLPTGILQIDYFHGILPGGDGPVAQMNDGAETNVLASEMFAINRPSWIVRCIITLQRRWRKWRRWRNFVLWQDPP